MISYIHYFYKSKVERSLCYEGGYYMNIFLMLLFVAVVGYVAYKSKGGNYFLPTSDSNMNLGLSYGATLISTVPLLALED